MPPTVKPSRRYRSDLRDEQALMTRRRILEAARRLLIGSDLVHVTMQAVAREAGVAYQTVYAQFGTKTRLALAVCDADLAHVPAVLALLDAGGDESIEGWLRTLAIVARRLYEPCADLLRFMRESGDPELLGRFRTIERSRRDLLAPLGTLLDRAAVRRPGPTSDDTDIAWALAGPETYEQLVLDRGWTPDRFERWLGDALVLLILGAGAGQASDERGQA